jgi:hypothetical protein
MSAFTVVPAGEVTISRSWVALKGALGGQLGRAGQEALDHLGGHGQGQAQVDRGLDEASMM